MTDSKPSRTGDLIAALRALRSETIQMWSAIDPARLEDERDWRGAPSELRFRLSWLTEGSESRRIQILGIGRQLSRPRMTDAQHTLGIAGEERGRLLGTLIGVTDGLFDRPPAEGEWSVRQVLGHVIAVDERYRIAVEHAIERARQGGTGPLRPPDSLLPPRKGEGFSTGTPAKLLQRMETVHDRLIESLSTIPDELLDAPTIWVSWDVDVRFRLHRFPAHDREHTIQLRKTLHALGQAPAEPQLLLADAQAALGALEVALHTIGDEYVDRQPARGGPSIADLVEQLLADERDI